MSRMILLWISLTTAKASSCIASTSGKIRVRRRRIITSASVTTLLGSNAVFKSNETEALTNVFSLRQVIVVRSGESSMEESEDDQYS